MPSKTANALKKILIFTSVTFIFCNICTASEEELLAHNRQKMVKEQIARRGIKDARVLDAMGKVKRHLFVPTHLQNAAYDDRPLPIGHGQTISQPYIVAYMTEAGRIGPNDRVLEIGTGSGYRRPSWRR